MIDIVTVTYQNALGLTKTYESIKSQTYENWRWVVVDGASTDGSVDFLRDVAKVDGRIFYVSEQDSGIYDAMNKGIKHCRDKGFVNFLNAGDLYSHMEVLERVAKYSFERDELVVGWSRRVGHGRKDYIRKVKNPKTIAWGMPFEHQAAFFSLARAREMEYSLMYRYSGDYEFIARFIAGLNNGEVKQIGEVVCEFEFGGVSFERRSEAILEDSLIRCRVLSLGVPRTLCVAFLHFYWHRLKTKLNWSR